MYTIFQGRNTHLNTYNSFIGSFKGRCATPRVKGLAPLVAYGSEWYNYRWRKKRRSNKRQITVVMQAQRLKTSAIGRRKLYVKRAGLARKMGGGVVARTVGKVSNNFPPRTGKL